MDRGNIPVSEGAMEVYSHSWDQESSTSSPQSQTAWVSDEEVILASSCPKKRAGRKKFKETRHPVYRGVRKRNNNRWVCEQRAPNNKRRIWLGTYPTAEMAARAHDVAALAFRGRMACLNFADSATILPVPNSGDIKGIQRAAAQAAEAFRPQRGSENERQEEESVRAVEVEEVSTYEGKRRIEYEKILQDDIAVSYVDEEATFCMPKLLDDMAEGMLISPPHHNMSEGFGWGDMEGFGCDEIDSENEVSLWSYST